MTSQQIKDLLAQNMDQASFEKAWSELQPILENIDKETDIALKDLHANSLADAKKNALEDLSEIDSLDRVSAIEDESISISIDVATELDV